MVYCIRKSFLKNADGRLVLFPDDIFLIPFYLQAWKNRNFQSGEHVPRAELDWGRTNFIQIRRIHEVSRHDVPLSMLLLF